MGRVGRHDAAPLAGMPQDQRHLSGVSHQSGGGPTLDHSLPSSRSGIKYIDNLGTFIVQVQL